MVVFPSRSFNKIVDSKVSAVDIVPPPLTAGLVDNKCQSFVESINNGLSKCEVLSILVWDTGELN